MTDAQEKRQQQDTQEKKEFWFRNCVFTSWVEPKINMDKVEYCIYQQEETVTTKRRHWQGYLKLKKGKRMRLTTLKRNVFSGDNTVHIDFRHGPEHDAIEYCRKCEEYCLKDIWKEKGLRVPGTEVVEFGVRPDTDTCGDSKTTESLKRLTMDIDSRTAETGRIPSMLEIYENNLDVCARFHSFVKDFVARKRKTLCPASRNIEVIVLWGEAGVGKTSQVIYGPDGGDVYKLDTGSEAGRTWFDGYDGETVLLIDDFYGDINIRMMLNILDRYRTRLPVKSSHDWAMWNKVYITSNVHPTHWYRGDGFGDTITEKQRAGLMRRITKIIEVKEPVRAWERKDVGAEGVDDPGPERNRRRIEQIVPLEDTGAALK